MLFFIGEVIFFFLGIVVVYFMKKLEDWFLRFLIWDEKEVMFIKVFFWWLVDFVKYG